MGIDLNRKLEVYEHGFITALVSKFGTYLDTPEEIVVQQDDFSNDMYFISRGDCTIDMRDYKRQVHKACKLLVEGDHFGEISMLYGCARTATVISRNYNTLAVLNIGFYRELITEYPKYKNYLLKHVFRYKDMNKKRLFDVSQNI